MSSPAVSRSTAAPARAAIPASPAERAARALAALDIDLPMVEAPAMYGVAMGLLVAWLIFIPLVYLSLVAFMGYLFAWHVWQTVASFGQGPFFIFHIPMALIGGILLLFLIKPIFFRLKSSSPAILSLFREDEPTLFTFVEKLCEATGAPMPTAIEVDCEANASARLMNGVRGAFDGKLVLRIGLPMVAGLNVRQFAGVLGHEFGHFNQRSGMTASSLIRTLSHFFTKIVFRRDRLDEKLAELRLSRLFYRVSILSIEANRGVLWMMLVLSELLTCGVLRRMEYDADNVEANIAGTQDFIRTGKLLLFLQLATRRAQNDLADAWQQQHLADNFPKLIVANARQLAEFKTDVLKLLGEQKTSWFDTHPCHDDRVANVERLGAAGLVTFEAPAKCLFTNFEAICRDATQAFYRSVIGKEMATAKLVPTLELVQNRVADRAAQKSLRRFFRDHVIGQRPIFPGPMAGLPPDDPVETAASLAGHRHSMLAAAEEIAPIVEQYETSGAMAAVCRAQVTVCSVFPNTPAAWKIKRKAEVELRRHEPRYVAAVRQLPSFEFVARDRLTAALQLLQSDDMARQVGKDMTEARAAQRTAIKLIETCHWLEPCLPTVTRLRELALTLKVFYSAYNPQQPFPPLVNRILGAGRESIDLLAKLRNDLQTAPYPFEHGTEGVSIGSALVGKMPDYHDPGETYTCVINTLEKFYTLVFRTLARLTEWAEKVEIAVGMDRLADPPEKGDKEFKETVREERKKTRKYWLGYGGRAVAGIVLLWGLIGLSLNPPSFGARSNGTSAGDRRPASFRPFRSSSYTPPPPAYDPFGSNPFPNRPGTPRGPHGPYGPNNPGNPNGGVSHSNPPPTYRPPTYQPPSPPSWGGSSGRSSPSGPPSSPGRR